MERSTVYISYDNPIDWVLTAVATDGTTEYVDANSFERFVLDIGADISVDSDDTGFGTTSVFDTSVTVLVGEESIVALRLRLGLVEAITAGSYKVRLVGYNTDWPEGLVWVDKAPFKFVA